MTLRKSPQVLLVLAVLLAFTSAGPVARTVEDGKQSEPERPLHGPPERGEKKTAAPLVLTLSGHAHGIYFVAFSPDGKTLATCGRDNLARLWDANTGRELLTLKGHASSIFSLSFSPDGKVLATAGEDHKVRLWDVVTGKSLHVCDGHSSDVYHVAFSPDGKSLASTGSDHKVFLWDPTTGKSRHQLSGHSDRVLGLTFTPDSARLISSCGTARANSDEGGEVKVWDVATGQDLFTLPNRPGVLNVAISPDGKRLAGACFKSTVRVWELATGKESLTLTGHKLDVYGVAFSPDGRWLASCSGDWNGEKPGEVLLWDLVTGKASARFTGFTAPIWAVSFSADGKRLAAASGKFRGSNQPGEVRVWDVSGLPRPTLPAPTAKELDALLADLAGADPVKAYRAVRTLAQVPRQALPLLDKMAKPPSGTSLERIPKLIKELDDEEFEVREKASAELEKLGRLAFPALRKALESDSLEVRRRAEELLEKKTDGPSVSDDELKMLRLIEVLQRINTPEVRPLLEKLGRGPTASLVSMEAKAALARVKK